MDFYDRIPLAKDLGLDGFEFWEPEKFDGKKIGHISSQCGLPVVCCCVFDTRATSLDSEWGLLKPNLLKTIEFGKEAGCRSFIGLAGNRRCKADDQKMVILENVKRAAEIFEKENVVLLIEALNSIVDHPGYYLDSSYLGFEIIKAADSPAIRLLYDVYHMQVMEGNLAGSLTKNARLIGHSHTAGVPGRHELHNGEINYPFLMGQLKTANYDGYVGFEYWPTYDHRQSVKDVLAYVKNK
jgi:hydroxypyruvate isomerase